MTEYETKLTTQETCAICKLKFSDMKPSNVHLDHDHSTNELREFLCTNCNRGLGHFQDSVDLLEQAMMYLRKHKK